MSNTISTTTMRHTVSSTEGNTTDKQIVLSERECLLTALSGMLKEWDQIKRK